VSDVSDEDATRMLATRPQHVVRVGLVEFEERHDTRTPLYTAADHRSTNQNQISAWQAERGKSRDTPDMRDILVASSRECRVCRRGCHEDATRKLLA